MGSNAFVIYIIVGGIVWVILFRYAMNFKKSFKKQAYFSFWDIYCSKGGMMMFKISDLRSKDIINTQDGKKLGAIKDIELDLSEGRIQAIILPGPGKFLRLFGRSDDIIVPWEQIKKIGRDVVLVELDDFHNPSNQGEDLDQGETIVETILLLLMIINGNRQIFSGKIRKQPLTAFIGKRYTLTM